MTLLDKLPQTKENFEHLGRYERSELYELTTKRLKEMPIQEQRLEQQDTHELKALLNEAEQIENYRKLYNEAIEEREALIEEAKQGGVTVASYEVNNRKQVKEPMENNKDLQLRSLQKYLTQGYQKMTEEETRALDQTGAGVVIPKEIANTLITDGKYSTLLAMATVFNDNKAGKLSIPIASSNGASWKVENANVDGTSTSYEATPTLTNIELGGYELYRWSRISAASYSLASSEFEQMMLNLLSDEVVEELEKAFIAGSGTGQPKGLDNLAWVADTNAIEATTAIAPADIAAAIALLPAKHAKNAIVMCNTSTLADIAMFKGSVEYAYNLSEGATKFLGHDIVVNEHIADDIVYVVDPKQLYVRFAMPIQVEANRSSGFTEASVDLRSLCVVDAAWNVKAVAKVSIAAAQG